MNSILCPQRKLLEDKSLNIFPLNEIIKGWKPFLRPYPLPPNNRVQKKLSSWSLLVSWRRDRVCFFVFLLISGVVWLCPKPLVYLWVLLSIFYECDWGSNFIFIWSIYLYMCSVCFFVDLSHSLAVSETVDLFENFITQFIFFFISIFIHLYMCIYVFTGKYVWCVRKCFWMENMYTFPDTRIMI